MNVTDFQQSLTWNQTLGDGSSAQVPLSCCLPQSNSSIQSTGGKMDCRKTPDVTNSYTDVKFFFYYIGNYTSTFRYEYLLINACTCIFLYRGCFFLHAIHSICNVCLCFPGQHYTCISHSHSCKIVGQIISVY